MFNALRILFLRLALGLPDVLAGPLGFGVKDVDGTPLSTRLRWFLRLLDLDTLDWKTAQPDVERDAFHRLSNGPIAGPIVDVHTEEHTVPGSPPVTIRLYRPHNQTEPLPAIFWIHGGGFVVGGLSTHDRFCRRLAADTQTVVIAANYRLSPEHPFPAALEDVTAVWQWMRSQTQQLTLDPSKLALAGDSAGGNMTAVLCQQLPPNERPAYQILCYPGTDFTRRHPSRLRYADGYFLTDEAIEWFLNQYCTNEQRKDPRTSPLLAPSITDQPPAFVITMGLDPLCDEGLLYADRLEEANTPVERMHEPAMIHGFINLYGALPKADELMTQMCQRINAHFKS
jgi:acetyl esterase